LKDVDVIVDRVRVGRIRDKGSPKASIFPHEHEHDHAHGSSDTPTVLLIRT